MDRKTEIRLWSGFIALGARLSLGSQFVSPTVVETFGLDSAAVHLATGTLLCGSSVGLVRAWRTAEEAANASTSRP